MSGLHALALTGPGVFHTTLNWPSALISPMNTLLCRWWFFSSIFDTMPEGAVKVWPASAAIRLPVSALLALLRQDTRRRREGLAGHRGDHLVVVGALGLIDSLLPHVDANPGGFHR